MILRFAGSYVFDEEGPSRAFGRAGGFALAASFIRELAVVATETGCRGRELLNGGESLGGAVDTYAWSRLLLLLGVTSPWGGCFRPVCVGVFARVVEAIDLACLLLLRPLTGGLRSAEGEADREEVGLELVGLASLLLMETGSLELADADACETEGVAAAASAATAVAVTVAAARAVTVGDFALVFVDADVDAGVGDLGLKVVTMGFSAERSLRDRAWVFGVLPRDMWRSLYQLDGDAGSASRSERLRWRPTRPCTLDSDVRRGRMVSMPKPGAATSSWPGGISPNRRPGN